MSADALRSREEADNELFDDSPAGESSLVVQATAIRAGSSNIRDMFKRLEKLMRAEQSKWWEHRLLSRYLEVGRIPRGLRIMLAPSYENPVPNTLAEWEDCNLESSRKLVIILVKYAESDRAALQLKIDELENEISNIETPANCKKY